MNRDQNRWLQLAHVALCAAMQEVECTDQALMEALFVGMPAIKIDDVTAAAVAEALRRTGTVRDAARALERSLAYVYDSLKRRRREWADHDWLAYGRELRRRRVLAGWSREQLGDLANLASSTIGEIENGRTKRRPTELTLAKLAAVLGMPSPPMKPTPRETPPSDAPTETGSKPEP